MPATFADGFAYIDKDGQIDVRSVSPTEMGALVNAIVILSNRSQWPQDYWSMDLIRHVFHHVTNGNGQVIKVRIVPSS